jgi:hypothetical protein
LETIEIVLASRYRHVLTAPRLFTTDYEVAFRYMRPRIRRVLRRQPTETESRRASAHSFVQMTVKDPASVTSGTRALQLAGKAAIVMFARTLRFVALFA